jgi:indolepyruvate ferredoxin oxidoreductase
VWDRERIIEAQEVLARVPGCTVLIHDQRCAAENRRDRKRGKLATPDFRVVINERVCEGCGDCGDKSNCLSVQPVDTEWGRKTKIDQSSCNFDFSCMKGDCPSFMTVTVEHGKAQRKALMPPKQPKAPAFERRDCTIRLSGIGGTGVVTVSQVLGTAAMIDGYTVRGLDQTGLSQKAGPVVSDVRITVGEPQPSNKATNASVDALIAFDELVAGSDTHLVGLSPDRTVAIASSAAVPTGRMVVHPDMEYPADEVDERIDAATARQVRVNAAAMTRGLLGDEAMANIFLLGVAVQAGAVPVSVDSVARAIELNGVAVDKNLAAFAWGRSWMSDPATTISAATAKLPVVDERPLLERLTDDLRAYQSAAYAERFTEVVAKVDAAGHPRLTEAVARNLHKLMAYKDEYEVARLLLLPEARAQAQAVGGKRAKVVWHLHPPMLRAMGMKHKMRLGRWSKPMFRALRAGKRVRGTPFDVFGYAKVRRTERAMIPEYVNAVDSLLAGLTDDNLDEAIAIAGLPDQVRGFEHLKMQRAAAYRAELAGRLGAFAPGAASRRSGRRHP